MKPLVSVIMPVRNGGSFLSEAVRSILAQTLRDLELILVDDRSTDGSIERLCVDDMRLRITRSQGSGVSSAFNTGFGLARGEFIARMDADDFSLPGRIEQQLDYLAAYPDIDLCGGCVEIFGSAAIAGGNRRYQAWLNGCRSPQDIHRELFIESPIPNPTALFRREALDRLGGYRSPDWPEDYDLYLRADAAGMRMGKPDQILHRWREHPGRLTRTDPRYDRQRFQAAKAHYFVRHRMDPHRPLVIWGAGPGGRLMHDLLAGEGASVTGFIDVHPRRIGGEKRGLPVWPVEKAERPGKLFVAVAVGAAGARDRIRTYLRERNWREGEDFLFLA